jgi:hypothetical protein
MLILYTHTLYSQTTLITLYASHYLQANLEHRLGSQKREQRCWRDRHEEEVSGLLIDQHEEEVSGLLIDRHEEEVSGLLINQHEEEVSGLSIYQHEEEVSELLIDSMRRR